MMSRTDRMRWIGLCLMAVLPACTAAPASVPAPARAIPPAFFVPLAGGAPAVQALAREQDRRVQVCEARRVCDRAHYVRALAALYEDRAVAVKYFQSAVAAAPAGPYAAPSLQWIRLLQEEHNGASYPAPLMQAAERLVRDVLERESAATPSVEHPAPKTDPGDTARVQGLKRELKLREKKIDELTKQIEALTRVDQEVKERVKSSRPAN
jgi:hypothetical protein